MSPSKFQDLDVTKGAMYNPSSSQFRINKDSHSIQKPFIGNSPRSSALKNQNPSSTKRPVIIYTHPPKIHYAKAHEFMALVQSLTGLNQCGDEKAVRADSGARDGGSFSEDKDFKNNNIIGYEENESSSVLTDEKYVEDYKFQDYNSSVSPPMYRMPNQYVSDVPLFSPSASDQSFMCSSASNSMFYEYPNMGGSFSPSFMDYDIKGFTEY